MVALNQNFTIEERADLDKIKNFFKEEICLYDELDFKTCYEKIPHEYLFWTSRPFWNNIDFKKQQLLYESISQSTFNKIWSFSKTRYNYINQTVMSLGGVADGEYVDYLIEIGQHNARIAKYATSIKEAGRFSSLYIDYREVLKDDSSFDLNDPNIQLILAIHYLSLNDESSRNAELIQKKEKKNEP